MRLVSSVSSIPHSSKRSEGEDAYFITSSAVGVADGVGGWLAYGVDAGLYSRKLMQKCSDVISRQGEMDPSIALRKAFFAMDKTIGTTTACLMTLTGRTLRGTNLGDSGFLVIRYGFSGMDPAAAPSSESDGSFQEPSWRIVIKSAKQQHEFNWPYQIGTDATEHPCDADPYEFQVERGDIVLLATDGVFDNLFENQICEIVARKFPNNLALLRQERQLNDSLDSLAMDIANEALRISCDEQANTPFSLEAREHRIEHHGGKQDDITVLLSVVYDDEEEAGKSLSVAVEVEEYDDDLPTSPYGMRSFTSTFTMKLNLQDGGSSPDSMDGDDPFAFTVSKKVVALNDITRYVGQQRKRVAMISSLSRSGSSSSSSSTLGSNSPRQRADSW
jgi:protein phosphatase PTC7